MFTISCPQCGAVWKVKPEISGVKSRCLKCKGRFVLPQIDAVRGPLGPPRAVAEAAAAAPRASSSSTGGPRPSRSPPTEAAPPAVRPRWKSPAAIAALLIGVTVAGVGTVGAFILSGTGKDGARQAATRPPADTAVATKEAPPDEAVEPTKKTPRKTVDTKKPPKQGFAFDKTVSYRDMKRRFVDAVKPLTLDVSKPLDRETRSTILRWAVLELQGEESFNRVVGLKRGEAFYADLMGSLELMDAILCSGDIPSPGRTIETLSILLRDDREGILNDPVLRNLAGAVAVWGFDNYRAHETYRFWKECRAQGLLHREFGRYSALEMRFVVEKTSPECAANMQKYHNLPMSEIGNIAWLVPYQGENIFQFDPLTGPWEHLWPWPAMGRDAGGVCGTVSYYGSAGVNARGLMSTPGEQPGHCAYGYRRLDGTWVIGNYVARPTGTHTRVLPLGNFMSFEYIDDIFADADGQNRAQELEYLALMARRELAPPIETVVESCQVFLFDPVAPYDVEGKAPDKELGAGTRIGLEAAPRNDDYVLRWAGRLVVPEHKDVTFRLTCDDSLSLAVDGDRIAALSAPGARDVVRTLAPGEHPFVLVFGQRKGARDLKFEISPPPLAYDDRIAEIHRAALRACPLHFNAIRQWGAQIAEDPGPDTVRMDQWVAHILETMGDHPENAWLLIKDTAIPCIKKIGGKRRVLETYERSHARLHDVPAAFWHPVDMLFGQLLEQMAATLDNDQADVFALFESGLRGQKDAPGCFADLLKWGSDRFLKDQEYADKYVRAVTASFLDRGDRDGLKGYVRDAIRRAQTAEDVAGFRVACTMRDQLDPPKLTQMKPRFKSTLLSADGLFRVENYHDSYPCTEHDRVVQEVEEGRARTSYGAAWGKVVLAGDCMIDGIYIRGSEHTGWQVPLKVSISADGKQWKEVFRTDQPAREWSVDLSAEPVHGRQVKVERAEGPNHFELEKVLVYGKRMY